MEIRAKIQTIAIGLALLVLATSAFAKEGRAALYEENETAKDLVARITAPTTEGAGIIFHVDEHYIYGITAKHVLYQQGKAVKDLKALFQAWPEKEFPVEVHKLHHAEDLAVFRADLRPFGMSRQEVLQVIPLDILGKSENLDPGDDLSAMGHSTAGAWITPKKWVPYARADGNAFLFEYPCPQGHSGGAVFDKSWRLVGMMIDEERPFCRALGIDAILKEVQR
ncbi:MAG TPA: serine protease, partial [Thermoanaerobaculia bacterium]|nr:serine protease [Thermoanaerobaculia bacterium]